MQSNLGRFWRLGVILTLTASTVRIAHVEDQPASASPSVAQQQTPNIVFIITDDQDVDTLSFMPRTQALLADRGTTFTNMFQTYPVCCPAHASILTGQYPHNTGILGNNPPLGGFAKFRDSGGEMSTVAMWLQGAGYRTARIGKYLVGYPVRSTHVPPGWDEWQAFFGGATPFFNYPLNENGQVVEYADAPGDYINDLLADKVVDFIRRAEENDDQPFFVLFAPPAPHAEARPNGASRAAPRHEGTFAHLQAPRTPSFNETDVSDKPPPIQRRPLLSDDDIAELDHVYRTRIESLLSIDEGVERIVHALAQYGELDNTYIFYTSDNGYHLGQHRLPAGKGNIYEEDIRVPLIVRGPGLPVGTSLDQFVLNIDFAPTFVELAGMPIPPSVDGRSLVPLWRGSATADWRTDFLVEIYRGPTPADSSIQEEEIRALRTRDWVYAEYASGPRELYDLGADPYQLESVHATADRDLLRRWSTRLWELAICAGESCRR